MARPDARIRVNTSWHVPTLRRWSDSAKPTSDFVIRNTKSVSAEDDPLNAAILGPFYVAYAFFNDELFNGQLPPVAILLQRSPRLIGGQYWARRLAHRDDNRELDEISINPKNLLMEGIPFILSILAHEMVHHWQEHFGKPPRQGYHDRRWAAEMLRIGLQPVGPDGKQTGQSMSQRIVQGGRFNAACEKLLADGFAINWGDCVVPERSGKPPRRRVALHCPECGITGWAEPEVPLACGRCLVPLT
jgi:hypothetical protein